MVFYLSIRIMSVSKTCNLEQCRQLARSCPVVLVGQPMVTFHVLLGDIANTHQQRTAECVDSKQMLVEYAHHSATYRRPNLFPCRHADVCHWLPTAFNRQRRTDQREMNDGFQFYMCIGWGGEQLPGIKRRHVCSMDLAKCRSNAVVRSIINKNILINTVVYWNRRVLFIKKKLDNIQFWTTKRDLTGCANFIYLFTKFLRIFETIVAFKLHLNRYNLPISKI